MIKLFGINELNHVEKAKAFGKHSDRSFVFMCCNQRQTKKISHALASETGVYFT